MKKNTLGILLLISMFSFFAVSSVSAYQGSGLAYDVGALGQLATLMTAFFGIMILLGILGFTAYAIEIIFGGIPFLGNIFRRNS